MEALQNVLTYNMNVNSLPVLLGQCMYQITLHGHQGTCTSQLLVLVHGIKRSLLAETTYNILVWVFVIKLCYVCNMIYFAPVCTTYLVIVSKRMAWYPGSGVVLDCIDSWSLHPYSLCFCRCFVSCFNLHGHQGTCTSQTLNTFLHGIKRSLLAEITYSVLPRARGEGGGGVLIYFLAT